MKTIVLIDGQNLFHLAQKAWAPPRRTTGSPYEYPSYDVERIAAYLVGRQPGRTLKEIRFYTGMHDPSRGPRETFWHGFWTNKLQPLQGKDVVIYKGRVNPNGQEKGVDVKLAVDLIELTYSQAYDGVIIVSQDWDFGSAVRLAKEIAKGQGRKLIFESAFPFEAGKINPRGVPGTDWVHIDKASFDACVDPTDYRP